MTSKDKEFLGKLLETFKVEAAEHLAAITHGLIKLEKSTSAAEQSTIIETIFREAHSLKGAARAVNASYVETVCQSIEGIFASLRRQERRFSSSLLDALHAVIDGLSKMVESASIESDPKCKDQASDLLSRLDQAVLSLESTSPDPETGAKESTPRQHPTSDDSPPPLPPSPSHEGKTAFHTSVENRPMIGETVRISTAKLDSIFLQTEELLAAKLAVRSYRTGLQEVRSDLLLWKRKWMKLQADVRTVRKKLSPVPAEERSGASKVSFPRKSIWEQSSSRDQTARVLQDTMRKSEERLLEFLGVNEGHLQAVESRIGMLEKAIKQNEHSLGLMVDNLLDDVKKTLMLPFSILLEIVPKIVRDLSRNQEKEIELLVSGAEIEIDKRILEELKDPLIHLVRNSIDHGLERLAERQRAHKSPKGRLSLSISQSTADKVEIAISDDGKGIDLETVRGEAVRLGIITPEKAQELSEDEQLMLIFHSGLSTAPIVTDISGRGLGLAIVREKVENLGGSVHLETAIGKGTKVRIVLPLTLASIRGILVRLEDRMFALPIANVQRVTRVQKENIKTVENRETVQINGETLSLVHLADVLELKGKKPQKSSMSTVQVVLLSSGDRRIAFVVDEVVGDQEILLKSLGKQLVRVRNVAGATVLGSGKVVLVLNVADLIRSATKTGGDR